MRLIDADKLKAHYAWWEGGTFEMTMDEAKSDFDTIVDLQPTVDAEPTKHGRWIYEQLPLPLSDGSKECVRCSVCGTHWDNESNYCPNCGARMDGGENDI